MPDIQRQRDVLLFALKELLAEARWAAGSGEVDGDFLEEVRRAEATVAEMESLVKQEV